MKSFRTHTRKSRWFGIAVVAALGLAACSSAGTVGGSGQGEPGDGGGADLPTQELALSDGTMTTISDLVNGKPLVVNFFASWCPPCVAEMPDFQSTYEQVKGEVGFVGIDLQDTEQDGAKLIELTGVEYPWGLDPSGTLYAGFRGFAMPTTIYITSDGKIAGQDNGPISKKRLEDQIAEFFGVQV